jgi:hypothetical protein
MISLLLRACLFLILGLLFTTASGFQLRSQDWKTYENTRFEYSIRYPSRWVRGQEPTNGDGVKLNIRDQTVDIRVYAGYTLPEGISELENAKKPGAKIRKLKIRSGQRATEIVLKQGKKVLYEVVAVEDGTQFHFYALVPKAYYEKNRSVLEQIAVSLKINPGGNR